MIILATLAAWCALGAWLWAKPDTVPTFADDYLVDKWEREEAEDNRKRFVVRLTCEVNAVFSGRSFYGKDVFGRRYNIGIADVAIPHELASDAKKRLEALVRDKMVRVEVYKVVPDAGVIGSIFFDDLNVGTQLVSEGLALAQPNKIQVGPSYRTSDLVAAQKSAMRENRGFWSARRDK
ncbi:MAG: hypothetical protein ACI9VS_003232 [Candidatus Binatia bacterium]|jgi:hypothetical protein